MQARSVIELNPAVEDFANSDLHRLPPSLILDVNEEMTVMQEEIFGPLLPIKTYDNIEEAVTYVRNHPRPLALYYFGNDLAEERLVPLADPGCAGCARATNRGTTDSA